jgi:hypothetical protein
MSVCQLKDFLQTWLKSSQQHFRPCAKPMLLFDSVVKYRPLPFKIHKSIMKDLGNRQTVIKTSIRLADEC